LPKAKFRKGIKKLDLNGIRLALLELDKRIGNFDKESLEQVFENAYHKNPWFTKENIQLSLAGLKNYLKEETLTNWLNKYDFSQTSPKKLGVVMAGNIPMVGIHDMICVLFSGHVLHAKLSSQDDVLIQFIAEQLIEIEPELKNRINFVERLKNIDAVIATGSDNTARYFQYYFSNIPHIIRRNRTSVAILDGNETDNDLKGLGLDVFSYYGLGCRNVSKIFLPSTYDPATLFEHWGDFEYIADHNKYHNNYHYQRSIMLVDQAPYLDCGFCLMVKSEALVSPISVIYFEFYENLIDLKAELSNHAEKIQCVVTNLDWPAKIKFGKAQMPNIDDFADNIDTMQFLANL
jgi:hypothetical protein